MTDIKKLNKEISDSGLRKSWIAEKLGISYQSFWNKLKGKRTFKINEIIRLSNILNLTFDMRERIFFSSISLVDKKSTFNESNLKELNL